MNKKREQYLKTPEICLFPLRCTKYDYIHTRINDKTAYIGMNNILS